MNKETATSPRFAHVFCSQCGRGFGPGDNGYSHCEDHAERREYVGQTELERDAARYRWLRSRIPGNSYRSIGVIYSEGGQGIDDAIDAAMLTDAQR